MIARLTLALFAVLLPFSAVAQLAFYEFNKTTETDTPVGAVVAVGAGETRFHVRNTGTAPVKLGNPSLSGDGFAITSPSSAGYILAPYTAGSVEPEIDVDFGPTIVASYSATLAINTISVVLTDAPWPVVTVGTSTAPLSANAEVPFGSVDVGATQTQGFVLTNLGISNISVATLSVLGTGFKGPIGLSAPVALTPGQTATFQISFTPQTGAAANGVLTVGASTFNLTGQGLAAPLPTASIVFASTLGASAQQNSVSIPLAAASQVTGTGTLTLTFLSSVTGVSDDPAIQFLSGPLRVATVSIAPGATSATIGGGPSLAFQTGTTAGTITFTLALGNNAPVETTLTITPSPIVLDSFTAVRLFGSLNVAFAGFDNTYSASQVAFTFYDVNDLPLSQGAITVDAASTFQQYFSTTQAGGSFALLATFPVTGDTSEIGYVAAQITNSLGATTEQQIPIGN